MKVRSGGSTLGAVAATVIALLALPLIGTLGGSVGSTLFGATHSGAPVSSSLVADLPRVSGRSEAGLSRYLSKGSALPERAVASYRKLPASIRDLVWAEQNLLSRELDTRRLARVSQNSQSHRFTPESAAVFEVETFWLDVASVDLFVAEDMPRQLRNVFVRQGPRGEQVRLLVHPESRWFYRRITRYAEPGEPIFATPTASSRTLLAWEPGKEQLLFFAKVSLDKRIGSVRRVVKRGEVARSMGLHALLASDGELPIRYMPEYLGMIPKEMTDGGMIVRGIPDDVLSGESRYLPLFSLYADPPNGERPMLVRMIDDSGELASDFIAERLIKPFAVEYVRLYREHALTSQPHGQNLLARVENNGLIDGVFLNRDLGGFDAYLAERAELGKPGPRAEYVLRTLERDYRQNELRDAVDKADLFFGGGVLFNLDQKLGRWMDKGWVPREKLSESHFQDLLRKELARLAPSSE